MTGWEGVGVQQLLDDLGSRTHAPEPKHDPLDQLVGHVLVGSQVGTLTSQVNSATMRLEVFDAREPIISGDRVVTSAVSTSYPAGLPVGVVVEDSATQGTSLTGTVLPFVEPDRLRLVVVLAWPPDPVSAATVDTLPFEEEETTTTSTTIGETTTTTAP